MQPKFMVLEGRDQDEPDSYLGPMGGIQAFVPTSSWEKILSLYGMGCKCLRSRSQTHLSGLSKDLVKTIFIVSV